MCYGSLSDVDNDNMCLECIMRFVLAAALSGLTMFMLAGLYTAVLARDFIAAHVDSTLLRPTANFPLLLAGYLMLGALMTWLYPRLSPRTGSPTWRGLRFGWMVGILWLMPYSLVLFGVYRFPYAALPLDFAWAFVEQGAGGLLLAHMLERRFK